MARAGEGHFVGDACPGGHWGYEVNTEEPDGIPPTWLTPPADATGPDGGYLDTPAKPEPEAV